MNTKIFLFLKLVEIILLVSFNFETIAQKTILVNLKEGYRQNPFSLNAKNIYTADYNIPFLDTNKFQVLNKGLFHYQPHQYAWQNYKSGKLSLDSLTFLMKTIAFDTSKLSSQKFNSTIYILIVYDKKRQDTMVALNNQLAVFESWKLVSFNSINRDFGRINSVKESEIVKFNTIELYENNTVIKRKAFINLYIDTTRKQIFHGLTILDSYFTYGTITVNSISIKLAVYNKFRGHYFDKQSTEIKVYGQNGNSILRQSYKFGDTIHINGHDIKFTGILFNGKRIEYIDLGKSNRNTTGFNVGYKYPSFKYEEVNSRKNYNTEELLQHKKYLLIDFWGTWCKPCIEGIPDLVKIYNGYKKDIEIISIASERTMDTFGLVNAIKKYGMSWHHIMVDNNESYKPNSLLYQYRVDSYPTYIIVDSEGRILLRTVGLKSTEKVNRILKDKLGY